MRLFLMAIVSISCFGGFTEVSDDSLYNYKKTKGELF